MTESVAGSPAAPESTKASRWEDFLDIFYAPSAVFARRERSSPWLPIIVVTVLLGTFFLLNSGMFESIMDAEFRRQMAARSGGPQLTEQQMAAGRAVGDTMAKVFAFIGTPIMLLLLGFTLWVVGKLVGAKQTLQAALVVAAFSYMPRVLEAVLNSVQGLLLDTTQLDGRFRLSLGAGRFFDPDTTAPALLAMLGRVDVFTIWVTVLLAIGLAVTGKIPRSQAAIAGAIMWLLGALPTVLPALLA